MPVCAYLALGSNIGDRERYLLDAIKCLDNHEHIYVSGRSHIYETDPVGYVDQDAFLNMVIEVETLLSAQELFAVMLSVENKLGRIREIRFGPRTIDLDLLLYDELRQEDPQLILPHPRMAERAFVLVPLVEVMQQRHSKQAGVWSEHLDQAEGKEGVRVWNHMQ
nr:2-amino-4-hydroxy-6-hydroxymethyldihydropteridine diphosphokinase [Paenibacillus sp. 1_12]